MPNFALNIQKKFFSTFNIILRTSSVDQALNIVIQLQQDDVLKKKRKKNTSTQPYFVMDYCTVT